MPLEVELAASHQATAVMSKQPDQQLHRQQHKHSSALIRHHSTPARFRRLSSASLSVGRKKACLDSPLVVPATQHLNRHQEHRHSNTCEPSFCCLKEDEQNLCHHLRHHHHHNEKHDSASPSASSSASDSAFSHSQTTLESESDQSAGFTQHSGSSLKTNDSFSNQFIIKSVEPAVESQRSQTPKDEHELHDEQNHFKIIWRNLSYKVPDKRFARVSAYLSRQKELIWPSRNEDNQASLEEVSAKNEAFDGQPMKAPVVGKPRKVIFSALNGCVKSGQLTAILGPSGAGKTTFLKCLTSSIVKGVTGSIDIEGCSNTSQHLKLCIIPQKG